MHIYLFVIVTALSVTYAVNVIADLLNLRSLSPELPREFDGVFDPAEYRRAQDYARVRARFDIVVTLVDLLKIAVFWALGGFNALDLWVRSLGVPYLVRGLLFIGSLSFFSALVSLPFEIYSTFVIERRFGFNRTSFWTFLGDRVKAVLLVTLLGGVVLAGVIGFFHHKGDEAWVFAWAVSSGFVLLMHFFAPTVIMPLFNKFTPLEEGELKDAIFEYARSVRFPLREIFVIDGSRRSTKANAFFTGFGKSKRIALFDTLVSKHSIPELVAILAHEIGHYKKGHVLKGVALTVLHLGALCFLLSLFIRSRDLAEAFGMHNVSAYAGLVFFGLLYTPISFALSLLFHAVSRHNEFEADRYAVETTGDADSLVKALKTLSATNLANLTPHPLFVFLKYTHPPVLERIRAIRARTPARLSPQ